MPFYLSKKCAKNKANRFFHSFKIHFTGECVYQALTKK
jgi:hypothetical protein